MRIFVALIVAGLVGCAPPGYHYEAGDFFILTPNDLPPSPSQPVAARQPKTATNSICGNATGSNSAIIAGRNAERYQECMEYKSYAFNTLLSVPAGDVSAFH